MNVPTEWGLEPLASNFIAHRQQLMDDRLEELRREKVRLKERLLEIDFEEQSEEISCLKETLAWQKLLTENDQPQD